MRAAELIGLAMPKRRGGALVLGAGLDGASVRVISIDALRTAPDMDGGETRPVGADAPLGEVAAAAHAVTSRAMREHVGRLEGAEPGAAANRAGRVGVAAILERADRERLSRDVSEAVLGWLREAGGMTADLLECCGLVVPRGRGGLVGGGEATAGTWDLAYAHREALAVLADGQAGVVARFLSAGWSADPAHPRYANPDSMRHVDEVRSLLGVDDPRWPRGERRALWRRFLAMDPAEAAQLEAALMPALGLAPGPGDVRRASRGGERLLVKRLRAWMLDDARRYRMAFAEDDEHADALMRLWLRAATESDQPQRVGADLQAVERLMPGGVPGDIVAEHDTFGGLLRGLNARHEGSGSDEAREHAQMGADPDRFGGRGIAPFAREVNGREFRFIELITVDALKAEGDAMGHCVGRGFYNDRVASGAASLWSIRLGGARLATAHFGRGEDESEPWYVREIAGLHNHSVTDEIRGVAEWLGRELGLAERAFALAAGGAGLTDVARRLDVNRERASELVGRASATAPPVGAGGADGGGEEA